MKPSTLTAKFRLDAATREVEAALNSLKISRESGPSWIVMASIDKTKLVTSALEVALGHVCELLEAEDADEPYPEIFDKFK